MTRLPAIERRKALKTIGAGIVGSATLTGSVTAGRGRGRGPKNVVEIEAGHKHDSDDPKWWLDIDKQEISGGWTTLKFDNQTDHVHFGYMVKVSEAALSADDTFNKPLVDFGPDPGDRGRWGEKWRNAVNIPFQDAWDPYYAGKTDVGGFVGGLLDGVADWFFAPGFAEAVGGPGFTGGGVTSKTTQYLDEGVYILECYVLDDEGRFHSPFGMVNHIKVTDEVGKATEPSADIGVSIDNDGIEFGKENLKPGRYTVEITFKDNKLYDNFLGHDVQLLRNDDVEEGVLDYWMNYLDPDEDGFYSDPEGDGPRDPGALVSTHHDPGPETFLGGVQDVYAGEADGFVEDEYPVTAYIDVTLTPGEYAWVAEVADPEEKDMLVEFTVTPPGQGK